MESLGYSSPILRYNDTEVYNYLDCTHNTCLSLPNLMSNINLNLDSSPPFTYNISIFLDIVDTLEGEDKTNYLTKVIEEYPNSYYNGIISQARLEYNDLLLNYDKGRNQNLNLGRLTKLVKSLGSMSQLFELPENDELILNIPNFIAMKRWVN